MYRYRTSIEKYSISSASKLNCCVCHHRGRGRGRGRAAMVKVKVKVKVKIAGLRLSVATGEFK
jgi:hypothetical protein